MSRRCRLSISQISTSRPKECLVIYASASAVSRYRVFLAFPQIVHTLLLYTFSKREPCSKSHTHLMVDRKRSETVRVVTKENLSGVVQNVLRANDFHISHFEYSVLQRGG